MSRGTYEIVKPIQVIGGDVMTTYGLSHLGDFEATLAHENKEENAQYFSFIVIVFSV